MEVKKQQNTAWNNRLVQNWERTTSRLYFSSCLFEFYAEYIMLNAKLDEAQAGVKIVGRNIKTSDMHMTPPLWQKARGTKEPPDESERGK